MAARALSPTSEQVIDLASSCSWKTPYLASLIQKCLLLVLETAIQQSALPAQERQAHFKQVIRMHPKKGPLSGASGFHLDADAASSRVGGVVDIFARSN
jgi:hypothetical protein